MAVRAISAHRQSPPRPLSSPVLVGRDAELHTLLELAADPPSVAVVQGQAGVGKTRLVTEVATRTRQGGRRVLMGRCQPLAEPFPLGPLVSALGELEDLPPEPTLPAITGALGSLLPELAHGLPSPPALSADPEIQRHQRFRAMRALIGALGPTLCILEDLHWSDEGTGDFLRFLLDDLPPELALVLTWRDEDLPAALGGLTSRVARGTGRARVVLEPFGAAMAGELVDAIVGGGAGPELVDAVQRRSAGLPFAIEELVRLADDRGLLPDANAEVVGALDVPPAVRSSVLERVAMLSPTAQRVVEAAAVVEVPAGESLLAAVADLAGSRAGEGLAEAIRAAVVVETATDAYGLRHPLAVQSVAESIPGPERRRLHLRAAEALEAVSPQPLARLAHHFREGGCDTQWVTYAEAAADLAHGRGDPDSAVRFLVDVNRTPGLGAHDRARLAPKLGGAAMASGSVGQRQAMGVLAALVDDHGAPGHARRSARRQLGNLLCWGGDASAGYDQLCRYLSETDGETRPAVLVMADLAVGPHPSLDVDERLRWLSRADDLATAVDDPVARLAVARARANLEVLLGGPTGWEAVDDLPTDAASPEQRSALLWTSMKLVWTSLYLGHDRRTRDLLDRTAQWDDIAPQRLVQLRQSAGLLVRFLGGHWDRLAAAAAAQARATEEMSVAFVAVRQVTGLLALASGDLRRAEADLREVAGRAIPAGLVRSVAVSSAGLARVCLCQGDPAAAWEEAGRGLRAVRASGPLLWASELVPTAVEAAIECGHPREARDLVAALASEAKGKDAPVTKAALSICRGLLAEARGDHERAAKAFGQAVRRFSTLPRPYEAAQADLRLGRSLLAAGNADGVAPLLDAHACFSRLGASADADDACQALAGAGVGPSPGPRSRPGRPSYGVRLSPREEQVAALAAQAMTNARIAAELHISGRTVEHHVATALRKLGLSSKRDLVTRRQGQSEDSGAK